MFSYLVYVLLFEICDIVIWERQAFNLKRTYADTVMMEVRAWHETVRGVVLIISQELAQKMTVWVGMCGHVEGNTSSSTKTNETAIVDIVNKMVSNLGDVQIVRRVFNKAGVSHSLSVGSRQRFRSRNYWSNFVDQHNEKHVDKGEARSTTSHAWSKLG